MSICNPFNIKNDNSLPDVPPEKNSKLIKCDFGRSEQNLNSKTQAKRSRIELFFQVYLKVVRELDAISSAFLPSACLHIYVKKFCYFAVCGKTKCRNQTNVKNGRRIMYSRFSLANSLKKCNITLGVCILSLLKSFKSLELKRPFVIRICYYISSISSVRKSHWNRLTDRQSV